MRVLLLTHSFNSLAQRLHVRLRERGHDVSVEFDIHDDITRAAVASFRPEVIVAPYLKRAIPHDVWRATRCLIVHPGPPGDRGPAALDWAILEGRREWGVTVLEAREEMDAGPVWASATFAMRPATKSSLYRREVADAAVGAVMAALDRIASGEPTPSPMAPDDARIRRKGPCRQRDRAIDWSRDTTQDVLRKLRSADGSPGVMSEVFGIEARLFDAREAHGLRGEPGAPVARNENAIAIATIDGAVWIGHLKLAGERTLKLPARELLGARADALAELADPDHAPVRYVENGAVGYLHFEFHNGAMGVAECHALSAAYARALTRPTRVLVLMGGPDYWSNGIHLGRIEAAQSPADESWASINAIDDLAQAVITTTDRLVIAALRGDAGAGGVFLALAADEVWAFDRVILNPHYKDMGNLHGSEFWTYLLPRRAGADQARRVTQARLPMGAREARDIGLLDEIIDAVAGEAEIARRAREIATDPRFDTRLAEKAARRAADEANKPLAAYRAEELARMRLNFFGFDPSYHVARYNFIHKIPKSRTPLTLARHRAGL